MTEDITVITITRNRPELLQRAMKSVQRQTCNAHISHLILIDDCPATQTLLANIPMLAQNTTWEYMPRTEQDRSGPGRSSRLRNYGVQRAESHWIAFLDDDNEWMENHLQELLRCAQNTGARAVHSQRKLLYKNGTPYLEERMPWTRNPEDGKRWYRELCAKGVVSPGSCVMRDQADPFDHPDPVRAVDTGSWLLARELLMEVPFRDDFNTLDETNVLGEDDKLLADLIAKRERIVCNQQPTLLYYLGGYSNNFDEPFDTTFVWR